MFIRNNKQMIAAIKRPVLLVNEALAHQHIQRMVAKTQAVGLELVPHFKTHQSRQIGRWFAGTGIKHINVSSVAMAQYFAEDGWQHITIAFPFNIREADEVADLAARVSLSLLITEPQHIRVLADRVEVLTRVYIEIDTSGQRSGVAADDYHLIGELIAAIQQSQHRFAGFYSHFGHTYQARGQQQIREIFKRSAHILFDLQQRFAYASPQLAAGDTPGASVVDDFGALTSLHPGNFVFYDLMQVAIGSCRLSDIAVALACPVVSKNADRQEIILYGGAVHLSKEQLLWPELGKPIYGLPATLTASGWSAPWPGCYLKTISQEHGVLQVTQEQFDNILVGDVIAILPVHSCLTADAMAGYRTLTGERLDHFKAAWPAIE